MANTEVMNCKCLNQHHFNDAEAHCGKVAPDSYTMNAYYNEREGTVHMQCFWCGYDVTHDVVNGNNVQVKSFSGKRYTLGPITKANS